jgi:hypothetical protein
MNVCGTDRFGASCVGMVVESKLRVSVGEGNGLEMWRFYRWELPGSMAIEDTDSTSMDLT